MRLPSPSAAPALLALLLLPLCGSLSPQEQTPAAAEGEQVSLSQLVLERYQVRNADPHELSQIASALLGRRIFVKENGPNSAPVSSVRLLGSTIVLYDTRERVERGRVLLDTLDAPREEASSYRSLEYRPRFLSLPTALAVVSDMVETSLVHERGLLVLHGRASELEAAKAMLTRIDVPEQQVLLTCQLLEPGGDQGAPLPRELTDSLGLLLPGSSFGQVGMAMLQTAVTSANEISVELETKGKRYRFSFRPSAFDQQTGALSVSDCALTELADDGPRFLFSTTTMLRANEYTVLAATGAIPRLLVVRVAPRK